ncbi:MAG TPA: lysophospholipid acyltransferase family protein [Candidatus Limnocylindrales bacterium]|nr:lysophospholipid acyltransferase family protein [Candidatus Limnocylindrales bacterium]
MTAPAEPGDPVQERPSAKPVLDEAEILRSDVTPLIATTAAVSRFLCRSVTRVRIEGDASAIPREGPVILAANHISNGDPVLIGAFLTPLLGRRIHWLGKKEMFDWPIVGWMARNGGVVPVDRQGADVEAFRVARRILDAGHVLMVFPEGTRSPTGQLQQPKDGLAMLALRTNPTIVPIGFSNTDRVWPKGRKIPRIGGHATMRIGEPFRLGDLLPPEIDRKAAKGLATTLIMQRIAALIDPRHRGTYGDDG